MITNEQLELTIKQHYSMGVEKKEIRSYEVSLWTLQDSFITVLKWSDVEQKGRIEHPKMVLDVDGTQELTFSIPMYYYRDGIRIENPNWYNTRNGNLIAGLRKIKVIFNKGDSKKEAVFEFVILNVDETHEKDILTCEVKCEGLAFHELGKIGYKIDLSPDGFYLKYKKWAETDGNPATEPIQDLDYWCQEAGLELLPTTGFINPSRWYYTVQMNQKSFENSALPRQTNKIYEETYTTAWDSNLNPIASKSYTIKARPIEIENSNIYNITQTIAETFGVFCRYDYLHDANYHIIAKIIIFYNNYFQEDEGYFSLTYPYSAERISRTMDSTDVTTKLYVLNVDDDNTLLGYHSIMDSEANKTKEDYILNFDYLHDIGTITDEQYAAVAQYEKDIRAINEELIPLQQNLATYQIKLPELQAKVTLYENSKKLDQEQINSNTALQNALDTRDKEDDGYISVTNKNPDSSIIIEDSLKGNYVNLNTNRGIIVSTLKVYTTWSSTTQTLSNEITNWTPVYDDYGNLISIKNISKPNTNRNRVYMTYKYNPQLYYQAIIDSWREKLGNDEVNYNDYVAQLGQEGIDSNASSGIYKSIKKAEEDIAAVTTRKDKLIQKFNEMMGPALREGYWQPESYSDYGEQKVYTENLSLSYSNNWKTEDTEQSAAIGWDNELFDGEQKSSYEYGSNQTLKYYPCIDLSNIYSSLSGDITQYSFYFNNNYTGATESGGFDWRYHQAYAVGSQAILSFAKATSGSEIKPILILVGARSLTDDQITHMKSTGHFGQITTVVNTGGTVNVSVADNNYTISWLDMSNYEIVMPRIKFSSLELKTQGNDLIIKYNNQLLKQFEDFYINTRNTERDETYYQEYFITIKPMTLLKTKILSANFDINYILSNANTAIYLDALEISHENAYPKVSYEISTNILNLNIINTLYNRLAQLVMINDTDLKFENTFGYISHLDLDLDAPQNDEVEIKNYKTKFEDLFSAIVAQTEQMKRASIGTSAAMSGSIPLSSAGFVNTLANNELTFNTYLDQYFTTSATVEDKLTSLFNDAGNLLGDASRALNNVSALSSENASILAGFAQTAAQELSTQVYRGETKPTSYKPGDIWIYTDANDNELGRYTAMSYSSEDSGNSNDPFSGFARTSDGSLASIRGAMLNINTEDGIIDIIAQDETSIQSGNHIYIAANNGVDIVGNKFVNIGGGTINITGSVKNFTDGTGQVITTSGGINLISTAVDYQNNVNIENSINGVLDNTAVKASKVFIHPDKISMSSAAIDMYAWNANSNYISAITLDGDKGIYIGSNKEIRLFSNALTYDNENKITGGSGSTVWMTPEKVFLGVSSGNNASVIDMRSTYIIMANGTASTDLSNSNIEIASTNSLTGLKITKESFGLAVGSGTGRTVVLANSNGLVIGAGTNPENDGSIVAISGNGVEIGSSGHLKVSTTNFKVNPSATGTTALFYVGSGGETTSDKFIKYSATNGLEITGSLTATSGTIGGWYIGPDFLGNGNTKSCGVGLQSTTDTTKQVIWAGYTTSDGDKFYIRGDGYLYAINANITGTITATSGTIGGWSLSTTTPNRLYSGTGTNYVAMDSGTGDYAFWAGNATASSAPFRVLRNGTVVVTSIQVKGENGSTTTVDLSSSNSTYPLWKLYYSTIKSYTDNSITLSNGATINFKSANVFDSFFTTTAGSGSGSVTLTVSARNENGGQIGSAGTITINEDATNKRVTIRSTNVGSVNAEVNCNEIYKKGKEDVSIQSWGTPSYTAGGVNVTITLTNGDSYSHFYSE